MHKAIIYSASGQDEPVMTQVTRLRSYCEALKWPIVCVYQDQDQDRDHAVYHTCQTPGGVLLVSSTDRLGPTPEVMAILRRLAKEGRSLVALDERIDTTTPWGSAFWNTMPLLESLAGYTASMKKRASRRRRRDPSSRIQYGYRMTENGPVPDEKEQAVLAAAREFRAQGMPLNAICRRFDA